MSLRFASIVLFMFHVGTLYAEDPQLIILIADFGPKDNVGHLFKLNIHHLNISRIPVGVVAPRALDYDHTEGLIYFTDLYTKQIRRVDINGGNDTEVAKFNSTSSPEGLTLDHKTRQVFYTDNGNNLIGRVEMNNFNHTVIVNTELDKPRGIVADTKNQKLYWVDYGSNPKIETSDYDGGERSAVIETGLLKPFELTLDEEEGRLYWTEAFNLYNSERKAIATLSAGIPSHMSLFNGFMYLTYFQESEKLEALPLDNVAEATSLSSGYFRRPQGIHAFSPNFEVKDPCPYGKYGSECSRCGACKEEIACEKTTGVCLRGCKPGYTTVKCTESCRPGTFGVDCQFTCNCRNSTCDVETGSCQHGCPVGRRGHDCSEQCTPGTFGQNCASRCSKTCKSNTVCDFMSGICAGGCQRGWKGDYCTERESPNTTVPSVGDRAKKEGPSVGCRPGTFGVDCQFTCNCRNSTCDVETGSCQHGCPVGRRGHDCSEQCTPGTFGQNCASRCSKTCKSNTVCDFMSGICAGGCQRGWKGDYCTERESPNTTVPSVGDRAKKEGPSVALIAGVVVVIAVVVLLAVVVFVVKRRRAPRNQSEPYATMSYDNDTKGIVNPS